MKIIALSCIPLDLEISCFGTLSKYIKDGHEVSLIISQSEQIWTKEALNAIKASSRIIGISQIYFVKELNLSSVTQDNVNKLRSHIESLNPTVAIFPSIRTQDERRKTFAKSSLLACRGIGNIIMYDPQKNPNFHPSIYSIMNGELEVKDLCLEKYNRDFRKNKTSKKKMRMLLRSYGLRAGIKTPAEAFETNRILLLNNTGF
jgi:hypothetical protein